MNPKCNNLYLVSSLFLFFLNERLQCICETFWHWARSVLKKTKKKRALSRSASRYRHFIKSEPKYRSANLQSPRECSSPMPPNHHLYHLWNLVTKFLYPSSSTCSCWPDFCICSTSTGVGSLLARFQLTEGPGKPAPLAVQFTSEGSTLSGCDIELAGPGYRFSLIKKRFAAGQF